MAKNPFLHYMVIQTAFGILSAQSKVVIEVTIVVVSGWSPSLSGDDQIMMRTGSFREYPISPVRSVAGVDSSQRRTEGALLIFSAECGRLIVSPLHSGG
jgi:hypothetical protein